MDESGSLHSRGGFQLRGGGAASSASLHGAQQEGEPEGHGGGGIDLSLAAIIVFSVHLLLGVLFTTQGNLLDSNRNRSRLACALGLGAIAGGAIASIVFELGDLGHSVAVRQTASEVGLPMLAYGAAILYPPHLRSDGAGAHSWTPFKVAGALLGWRVLLGVLGALVGTGTGGATQGLGAPLLRVLHALGLLLGASALLWLANVGWRADRKPVLGAALFGLAMALSHTHGMLGGSGGLGASAGSCLALVGLAWPWLRATDDRADLQWLPDRGGTPGVAGAAPVVSASAVSESVTSVTQRPQPRVGAGTAGADSGAGAGPKPGVGAGAGADGPGAGRAMRTRSGPDLSDLRGLEGARGDAERA